MSTQVDTIFCSSSEDIKQKTLSSVLNNLGSELLSNELTTTDIENLAIKIDAAFRAIESGGDVGKDMTKLSTKFAVVTLCFPTIEQIECMVRQIASSVIGQGLTHSLQQSIASRLQLCILQSLSVKVELTGLMTATDAIISG